MSQNAAGRIYTILLKRHAVSPRESSLHNPYCCFVVENVLYMETNKVKVLSCRAKETTKLSMFSNKNILRISCNRTDYCQGMAILLPVI